MSAKTHKLQSELNDPESTGKSILQTCLRIYSGWSKTTIKLWLRIVLGERYSLTTPKRDPYLGMRSQNLRKHLIKDDHCLQTFELIPNYLNSDP
jgi:hypothetical protein